MFALQDHLVEHTDLIFVDRDSPPVNDYHVTLLHDDLGALREDCRIFEDDRDGEIQTAVHCSKDILKSQNTCYCKILCVRAGVHERPARLEVSVQSDSENQRHESGSWIWKQCGK